MTDKHAKCDKDAAFDLTLLATNDTGYRKLVKLST